jgi:hypothetical protein
MFFVMDGLSAMLDVAYSKWARVETLRERGGGTDPRHTCDEWRPEIATHAGLRPGSGQVQCEAFEVG